MANTERIQANNAALREAIEMAEALPDGGGLETCEVNVLVNGYAEVYYTDGSGSPVFETIDYPGKSITVLKNSSVFAFGDFDPEGTTLPFNETLWEYGYPVIHVPESGVIDLSID